MSSTACPGPAPRSHFHSFRSPLGAVTHAAPFPRSRRESELFLLDVQDLRAGTEGWLVFDVTAASSHWSVHHKFSLGLRLYVETDEGESAQAACSVWGQTPGNWGPLGAVGCGDLTILHCNFRFPALTSARSLGLQVLMAWTVINPINS